MKKENFIFLSFLLGAVSLAAEKGIINEKWTDAASGDIQKFAEKIYPDADDYLLQAIVESRYISATSVVWVYGCADKS